MASPLAVGDRGSVLAGLSLNEFYQPASDASRTVLLYEVEDGKIAFRHQEGTNILTVDFHA